MKKSFFIKLSFCLLAIVFSCQQFSLARENQEIKGNSVRKFTIPEHDLYPENIAYDPVSKSYFLGSMSQSRIIRINAGGSYDDFVSTPDSGLLSSIGMKVDANRRALWVCTGRFSLLANYDSLPPRTGILKFNIDTGELINKWIPDENQASPYHIFNDLVLTSSGDVYATTTLLGRVYKISADNDEMEIVLQHKEQSHNNGITIDDDEKYLFLTINRSICRMDLKSKELLELKAPKADMLLMTDGLYFHDNSLIAVKPRLKQVLRLFLKDDLLTVNKAEVLAQNHPDFAYPTTGVVVDDKLVFVASSYANIPRNNESPRQHDDVYIHEVSLREED